MDQFVKREDVENLVSQALAEDIGGGDLTAALIADGRAGTQAELIAREPAILCGSAWFGAVFRQLDPAIKTAWIKQDGQTVSPNQTLCRIQG